MTQAVETMKRQWGHGVTFILMVHLWIPGEACPYGFYGPGCFFPCSGNCRNNATCNSTSGLCDNGCKTDYVGPLCVENIASFSVPKAAAFAIAAVALCVAITAIALPLVLYYRSKYIGRHRQKTRRNPLSRVLTLNKRGSIFMPSDIQIMKMKSRQSLAVSNGGFVPRDLAINELANLLRYDKVDGYEELNREYQVVPVGEQSHLQCSVSRQRENQFKNRAEITLPYDHSRVKLERTASDYINASYIEMAEDFRCIASQGPLEGTVADHWTMIWQERVSVVVMLTNLMEDDKEKCYPYWYPKGKVLLADSLSISVLHEKVYAFYTTRNIKIEDRETKECRLLCHFQFTRWTDRAIPYPSELVQFYRTVRHAHDSQPKSTLLVHCSDGGGRTGIFIALDKLHRAGRRNSKVNVAKCLTEMCEQRMNIVENVEQYILLYHTLRESFHQHANLIRKENLRRAFAEVLNNVSGLACPGELLAVMGPSGAGKSTLLNTLAGRTPLTSGTISVNGHNITKDLRRKICYVLQQDIFFSSLTLKETLQFTARIRLPEKMSNAQITSKVNEIIQDLDLSRCVDTIMGDVWVRGLSGGEKKRASIACELITDPVTILLDEPTSGLDYSTAFSLIEMLQTYARNHNKTVVATIHQPSSFIFYQFHKLLLVSDGEILTPCCVLNLHVI